jgi:hydroxyethylthiazole kinase
MSLVDPICADLEAIRRDRPLVHSITNFVVMNETANAILCLGALPIMSHAVEEVAEMVGIAGALVLNIGTLQPDWIEAMVVAGKRANELGIPVILDPVGAGATKLRTESSRRLLEEVKVSITRGNKGEIAALAGVDSVVKGVESISASASSEEVARRFAKAWGCCAAVTGVVDVVHDDSRIAHIGNGHEMLSKLVGTGCMSDVIVAAFAAVNPDPFAAACGALVTFGIAGEMAAEVSGDKPGTFHVELYNTLHAIDSDQIRSRAKLDVGAV